ncbi:MAG: hypothetical protein IIA73_07390 [Proteobacteria bacterium]|nr:hypothetical protein [Pseudomonadota bacterium]
MRTIAQASATLAVTLVLLVSLVLPAAAEETLPVIARVGPWPVASELIGYGGRLWFVNSVKFRDHNSADIYAYDPASGTVRYERHLFSQDAGTPLVFGGLLYWPFEDSRFSLGWGHFAVTDGERWRIGAIPTARTFHVHAMAALGERIVAATSAWRAGLQVSDDRGASWREAYDHPTEDRRVSRIVDLAAAGDRVYGALHDRSAGVPRWRLVSFDGDAVAEVPGWPEGPRIVALTQFEGRVGGAVREAEGDAIWCSDGARSERIAGPKPEWRLIDRTAGAGVLFALAAEDGGGSVWRSDDGKRWRPAFSITGGRPHDIAEYAGNVYVAGEGDDGRGLLWGPAPPAPAGPRPSAGALPRPVVGERDWRVPAAALDRALADPESYVGHAAKLRDLAYRVALAGPPEDYFGERLARTLPAHELPLMGGKVIVPAGRMGRWVLLWAMGLSGTGRAPPGLLAEPWTAAANSSEKYFESAPAAMSAAAWLGHADGETIGALIDRLGRAGEPLWLKGDAVGALTALTGKRFGYDLDRWRAWWRNARR